jgi:predicted MPP superfamily phosphohydrolase
MLLFSLKNNGMFIRFCNRVGVCLALLLLLVLSSCASLARYQGVGRIRRYEICDARLPHKFDGFTIAFISDTHFPSKFTRKRLANVTRALCDLSPDALLLGGDYVTSDVCADELFAALGRCDTPFGKYAVLGNHDVKSADMLRQSMQRNGIKLLADAADTLRIDGSHIYLCGIKEYGNGTENAWLQQHADSGFTVLLVHTPDYAQDAAVENVALTFSGHTHGGQVTLLGFYAPVTNSRYGKRFLSGLNFTDKSVPVITSNGLGTSRRKIRFCAPSDIIFVTLRCR